MNRLPALILTAALLSACVAVTVERHHPRKGPIKEVGYIDFGGGEVRYSAEGWKWIVSSRRKTALRLMRRNCGPDLTPMITDEYTRVDADATYNGEDIDASMKMGGEHYQIERYTHLLYECRAAGTAAPALSTSTVHGPVLVIPSVPASTTTAAVELSTAAFVSISTSAAFAVPPSSAVPVAVSSAPVSVPSIPATSTSTLAVPEPPR
jgi:hypothetical protein